MTTVSDDRNLKPAFADCNIPVVFATDNNYLPYLKVAVRSLLANLHGGNVDIIILHDCDIEKDALSGGLAAQAAYSIRFLRIDKDRFVKHQNQLGHVTVASLYRLMLPELLPDYGKVLYLDVDIAVNGNIAELYNADLGGAWIGAALEASRETSLQLWSADADRCAKRWTKRYGFEPWKGYFNAGVLLMDLAKLRDAGVVGRLLEIAQDPDSVCYDQDALNVVCRGHVKYLDKTWNYNVVANREITVKDAGYMEPSAIKIFHFLSHFKPWSYPGGQYCDIWYGYVDNGDFVKKVAAASLRLQNREWEQRYAKLKHSFSYRLGRALTKPFRAVFGG